MNLKIDYNFHSCAWRYEWPLHTKTIRGQWYFVFYIKHENDDGDTKKEDAQIKYSVI